MNVICDNINQNIKNFTIIAKSKVILKAKNNDLEFVEKCQFV